MESLSKSIINTDNKNTDESMINTNNKNESIKTDETLNIPNNVISIEKSNNIFIRNKTQSMKYKIIPENDTIDFTNYKPPTKSSLKRQSASFNLFDK